MRITCARQIGISSRWNCAKCNNCGMFTMQMSHIRNSNSRVTMDLQKGRRNRRKKLQLRVEKSHSSLLLEAPVRRSLFFLHLMLLLVNVSSPLLLLPAVVCHVSFYSVTAFPQCLLVYRWSYSPITHGMPHRNGEMWWRLQSVQHVLRFKLLEWWTHRDREIVCVCVLVCHSRSNGRSRRN